MRSNPSSVLNEGHTNGLTVLGIGIRDFRSSKQQKSAMAMVMMVMVVMVMVVGECDRDGDGDGESER